MEGSNANNADTNGLAESPIILQYLFFLTANTLATFAQHATVRLLVRWFQSPVDSPFVMSSPGGHGSTSPDRDDDLAQSAYSQVTDVTGDGGRTVGPGRASPSAVTTALLMSSCIKLFPILLVIWPTQTTDDGDNVVWMSNFASRARTYVGWAVLLNNTEALRILLDCGYVAATGLSLAGSAARWQVEGIMLGMVGLEGDESPIGDMSSVLKRVGDWLVRK